MSEELRVLLSYPVGFQGQMRANKTGRSFPPRKILLRRSFRMEQNENKNILKLTLRSQTINLSHLLLSFRNEYNPFPVSRTLVDALHYALTPLPHRVEIQYMNYNILFPALTLKVLQL